MTENYNELYSICDIFYVNVKVEPFNNNRDLRCIKYGLKPPDEDCPKSRLDKATGCNCGSEQTANHCGFPNYTQLRKGK